MVVKREKWKKDVLGIFDSVFVVVPVIGGKKNTERNKNRDFLEDVYKRTFDPFQRDFS